MISVDKIKNLSGRISLIEYIREGRDEIVQNGIEIWQASIDGKSKDAILLHPPGKVQFTLPNYQMQFSASMAVHPEAWDKASPGGCRFSLFVDESLLYQIEIDPISNENDQRWFQIFMDLPACRIAERILTFETEAIGGEDYRWALWGDPYITITDSKVNPPQLITNIKAKELQEAQGINEPIFIFGIARRSGTNFLMDLLARHPDCKASQYIGEDFFVARSKFLRRYTQEVTSRWQPGWWWNYPHKLDAGSSEWAKWVDAHIEEEGNLLLQGIGMALLRYLASEEKSKRLITKTPTTRAIKNFPILFPGGKALIVIRDGRSVIESAQKTFGTLFNDALDEWVCGAKWLLEFDKKYNKLFGKLYLIVKYEDLYQDTENQLRKLFKFLDLNADVYDFEGASDLPVRGSSQFKNEIGQVIWTPVPKSEDFNPLKRWEEWETDKHMQFNQVAGRYMNRLGYL
jgi:hypothetical protein